MLTKTADEIHKIGRRDWACRVPRARQIPIQAAMASSAALIVDCALAFIWENAAYGITEMLRFPQ